MVYFLQVSHVPEGPQPSSDYNDRPRSRDSPDRSPRRNRSHSRERYSRSSRSDRDRYRGDRDRGSDRREKEENDKSASNQPPPISLLSLLLTDFPLEYNVNEAEKELRSAFVRNLPIKAKDRDIAQFFDEKTGGKVREVRMIQDKHSSKHKGYEI